jgi:hypothetical protein
MFCKVQKIKNAKLIWSKTTRTRVNIKNLIFIKRNIIYIIHWIFASLVFKLNIYNYFCSDSSLVTRKDSCNS